MKDNMTITVVHFGKHNKDIKGCEDFFKPRNIKNTTILNK